MRKYSLSFIFLFVAFKLFAQTKINRYEYWFDNNFVSKVATTVSPAISDYVLNSSINTSALKSGLHTFNIRFRDNTSVFSSIKTNFFYKSAENISYYEYWLDGDYKGKTAQTLSTPSSIISLSSAINTSALKPGIHTFNIFFRDAALNYSEIKTNYFYKSSALISAYEFWFDSNYKGKVSQNISPSAIINIPATINAGSLKAGLHQFNIRFQGNDSTWSEITSKYFYQQSIRIKGYEYWFDNNYSEKVSINISPSQTFNLTNAIYTDNLGSGYHTFNIRFKDPDNTWTTIETTNFLKLGSMGIGNAITAYRYWFDAGDTILVNKNVSGNSDLLLLNDSIKPASLSAGYHKLNFQFKDITQNWSFVKTHEFRKIGAPRLDYITPNKIGNKGYSTINVFGDGFYKKTKTMLVLNSDTIIPTDSLAVIIDGNRLISTFNFDGAQVGTYDVILQIPELNDTILKLKNALQVENVIEALPSIEISGSSSLRVNEWTNYSLSISNNSNVNIFGLPFYIAISAEDNIELNFNVYRHAIDSLNWDTIPLYMLVDTLGTETGQFKLFALYIPKLNPYEEITLPFKVMAPHSLTKIKAWIESPFLDNSNNQARYSKNPSIQNIDTPLENNGNYKAIKCIGDFISLFLPFPSACAVGIFSGIILPTGINFYYEVSGKGDLVPNNSLGDVGSAFLKAAIGCIPGGAVFNKFQSVQKGIGYSVAAYDIADDCGALGFIKTKILNTVFAVDPNEKFGPVSLDTVRKFISNANPLNYTIQFENDSAASAPAKTITIIDSLNTAVFNTSTFNFGNISIGDAIINIPPGLKSYSANFDLSPYGTPYSCKITAGINLTTGVITWNLQTLDPYTLIPVTNSTAGILPPNLISPKGQGAVTYSVKTLGNLSLNTSVDNKAHIIFDNNAPIKTGTWHNALDNIKPQSAVSSLLPNQNDSSFTIKWSGSDVGSGLLNYNIYYSVNGGSYKLLLSNSKDTTYMFHGYRDSTYYFYSIACDSAFNKEDAPVFADAATHIKNIIVSSTITNVLCNGKNTGAINVSVSEATPPLSYQWSNGNNSNGISLLTAGFYTITITDAGASSISKSYQITEPTIISVSKTIVNDIPAGAHNGSVSLNVSGGKSPYTYQWSNGSTTKNISGLIAGTYTVTITDINQCNKITANVIGNSNRIASEENGESSTLEIQIKKGNKDIYILLLKGLTKDVLATISDAAGREIYKCVIKFNGESDIGQEVQLNLKKQVYFLKVNDGTENQSLKFFGE